MSLAESTSIGVGGSHSTRAPPPPNSLAGSVTGSPPRCSRCPLRPPVFSRHHERRRAWLAKPTAKNCPDLGISQADRDSWVSNDTPVEQREAIVGRRQTANPAPRGALEKALSTLSGDPDGDFELRFHRQQAAVHLHLDWKQLPSESSFANSVRLSATTRPSRIRNT